MLEDRIKDLSGMGVDVRRGMETIGEETYFQELERFIQGMDFMRLGQAVNHGKWEIVMMNLRRMDQTASRLGAEAVRKQLAAIRSAAAAKNTKRAKDALALLVSKRVQILKYLNTMHTQEEGL